MNRLKGFAPPESSYAQSYCYDSIQNFLDTFNRNQGGKAIPALDAAIRADTPSFGLLLRVASLRFVLISHPKVMAALPRGESALLAALDEAVVEAVYPFVRAIEHDETRLTTLLQDLDAQGMQSPGHAAALALL